MSLLTLTQNNRRPRVNFVLTSPSSGSPIDLSGATLKFAFTPVGASSAKFIGDPTINVAANGTCYYEWGENDLDTPGHFHGQIRVAFPDGKKQSSNIMGFYVQPDLTEE